MVIESPPFSVAAAEAFVMAHGTPRQRAYWKAAFGWGPVEVWLFEMEAFQGPQGGWGNGVAPADGGRPDSLPGTAEALGWLAWLNLGEDVFEVLPRTLRYLEAGQAADGSWGDLGSTVAIGAHLAFLGELSERVDAAARWVAAQDLDALPPAQQALALAVLRARPGMQDRGDRLYASLEAYVAGHPQAPTVTLAALHEGLVMAGYGPSDELRRAVLQRLGTRQQPDGSFAPDDPSRDAVDTTFLASRALVTR